MKLLKQYHCLFDAEKMAKRLENKGIATHVSSKRSHSLSRHRTGAIKVCLWAVLNHQHQDAIAYLHNSKHKVTTSISLEEVQILKQQASEVSYSSLNKFLTYTFTGIALIVLIIYIIISKVGTLSGV